MSRSGGYTDAERLALEWTRRQVPSDSKQQQQQQQLRRQDDYDRNKRKSSRYTDSSINQYGESSSSQKRDPQLSRDRRRNVIQSRSRSRSRSRHGDQDRDRRYNKERDDQYRHHTNDSRSTFSRSGRASPTYSPYRGNDQPPSSSVDASINLEYPSMASQEDIKLSRERYRSRSRSRSRSKLRRSRSRSPSVDEWRHDKYDPFAEEDARRSPKRLPDDYRPPSPAWVSRAGGVAIIRRKSTL